MGGQFRLCPEVRTVPLGDRGEVSGTSDYNGNGEADILWRHTPTGTIAMWFMNARVSQEANSYPRCQTRTGRYIERFWWSGATPGEILASLYQSTPRLDEFCQCLPMPRVRAAISARANTCVVRVRDVDGILDLPDLQVLKEGAGSVPRNTPPLTRRSCCQDSTTCSPQRGRLAVGISCFSFDVRAT